MGPVDGGHDSAAQGEPSGGGSGIRIRIGRFSFALGSPDGTRADLVEGPPADATELAQALNEPEVDALTEVEETIGEAESVTGKVEHALDLFTKVARGEVPIDKSVQKQLDSLIDALERSDREGRHKDTIRLARAGSALFALAGRWIALVTSLRMALQAARSLGDARSIGWALHELGTLALGADDAAAAENQLTEARHIRKDAGDEAGSEVTQHNLQTYKAAFSSGPSAGTIAALAAGALLVVVGGIALVLWLHDGDDGPPAPDTTAPKVEITSSPDDPTVETSASFAFEADEPVSTFECRLDGGSFEKCDSPKNAAGPLDPGGHTFAVRAVDLAGNTGKAATFEWTIEAGEGPGIAITDGPDELTNQPRAEFTLQPGDGAVSLECSRDGGDFEACPNLVAFDVEKEGDHTFTARALNAAGTAGPSASYSWTLDTTPPTVEIGSTSVSNHDAVIEFTPSEQVSLLECSLQAPPAAEPECVSPITYDGLTGSTDYVFSVVATDAAGNVGEPAQFVFTTDADVD